MKEKKSISENIELPKGVNVELKDKLIKIKGAKGENSMSFNTKVAEVTVQDNQISLKAKGTGKVFKKQICTLIAHLRNMIKGVTDGFTYKLKICSGHFPMSVTSSGGSISVKNYFGEKTPRVLKIKQGAEVKVEGDTITVTGIDKSLCGQVAADIEKLASRTSFDRRIFQDGIYIINKAGKDIE
ncbi:MAG: 50S ribosomal protein L6 [Nanoarchaeota archaeon]|nr:50S ribosomal protein L6 [Nanoarchaeota archaeon]MBU1704439.1 50S ribosomal protein L6 [Nanoarchaeota archaeon]